jgi:hypothetical protein
MPGGSFSRPPSTLWTGPRTLELEPQTLDLGLAGPEVGGNHAAIERSSSALRPAVTARVRARQAVQLVRGVEGGTRDAVRASR